MNDDTDITDFTKQIAIEKVYPLSIINGNQTGEIYVDDSENPTVALFWHYCGFAFIAGKYSRDTVKDIYEMMQNPTEKHRNRMIVQTDDRDMFYGFDGISRRERYIFQYIGDLPVPDIPKGCRITIILFM